MSRSFVLAFVVVAASCATVSTAADLPPDVLVKSDRVTITRADVEAELASVRPDLRNEFSASSERLSKLLNAMLEAKTLATEARANGLDKDPAIQARVAAAVDRVLGVARAEQIERDAGAAFDRRRDEFMGRVRENYLLDKAKYTLPEQVRAAHILIKTENRDKDAALKLALEIRAKAMAEGADFAQLARQYSEDPTAKTNGGNLGWFSARQMDRAFSTAAFALTKPGQISEPVLSSFGYHIIRFEDRRPAELQPYDKVKDVILADVRREYVDSVRRAATMGIFGDPTVQMNQPAIDSLLTTLNFDPVRKSDAATPK
jgi:peptidyl-prolyl cis-trans isomerase C